MKNNRINLFFVFELEWLFQHEKAFSKEASDLLFVDCQYIKQSDFIYKSVRSLEDYINNKYDLIKILQKNFDFNTQLVKGLTKGKKINPME